MNNQASTLTPEAEEVYRQHVLKLIEIASSHVNANLVRDPQKIHFYRLGNKFGFYRPSNNSLHFNTDFILHDPEHFLSVTAPHEVSHLAIHTEYGRYYRGKKINDHGAEWKAFMRNVFNIENPRATSSSTLSAPLRKHSRPWQYKCNCQTFNFTNLQHSKILFSIEKFGHSNRLCVQCRHRIVFTGRDKDGVFTPAKDLTAADMPAPKAPNTWKYQCGCQIVSVIKSTHDKWKRGHYYCPKCDVAYKEIKQKKR